MCVHVRICIPVYEYIPVCVSLCVSMHIYVCAYFYTCLFVSVCMSFPFKPPHRPIGQENRIHPFPQSRHDMEKLRILLLRVYAIPLQRLATLRDSFHPRGSFSGFLLVADEHLRTGDASNCQSVWETLPQTSPSQLRFLWYQGALELLRRETARVLTSQKNK